MSEQYSSLYVSFSEKRGKRGPGEGGYFGNLIGLMIVSLFLAGALGKVYFDRQAAKITHEWNRKNAQITILLKESENLQMEQEQYMRGAYILTKARQLGLKPSEPGQVRIMKKGQRSRSSVNDGDKTSMVASR